MNVTKNYWRGKPAIKTVVLKVVSSATALEALKKGEIDYAEFQLTSTKMQKKLKMSNFLQKLTLHTHISDLILVNGIRKERNIIDPNDKMANKLVRQAMWHAMDNETIGKELYHGLRFPATSFDHPCIRKLPRYETIQDVHMTLKKRKRFLTKLDILMLTAMASVKMTKVKNSFLTSLQCQVEKQQNRLHSSICKTGLT